MKLYEVLVHRIKKLIRDSRMTNFEFQRWKWNFTSVQWLYLMNIPSSYCFCALANDSFLKLCQNNFGFQLFVHELETFRTMFSGLENSKNEFESHNFTYGRVWKNKKISIIANTWSKTIFYILNNLVSKTVIQQTML